jgi:alpha-beta hydrolase superfamily lysophospholipase
MDLSKVKAPTLIIHSRGDLSVPLEEGRLLAAGIPNSRLVTLESRNHLLLEADPAWDTFVSEVRNFLGKQEFVPTVNDKARKKTGLGISGWIKGPETRAP